VRGQSLDLNSRGHALVNFGIAAPIAAGGVLLFNRTRVIYKRGSSKREAVAPQASTSLSAFAPGIGEGGATQFRSQVAARNKALGAESLLAHRYNRRISAPQPGTERSGQPNEQSGARNAGASGSARGMEARSA